MSHEKDLNQPSQSLIFRIRTCLDDFLVGILKSPCQQFRKQSCPKNLKLLKMQLSSILSFHKDLINPIKIV